MTEIDALRELQAQMSEVLWMSRVMLCGIVAGFAASAGMQAVQLRRVRRLEDRQTRFEERQARLEVWQDEHGPRIERLDAWQEKHGAPLERLALEQDASSDPARAAAVRHPHRGGSRDAPL